jgi:NTP pyrophosphatase (non-canonical NTP hydrolase)
VGGARAVTRPIVSQPARVMAVKQACAALDIRLAARGEHAFVSRHEILGVLEEEMHELREAVRSGSIEDVRAELEDIVVAALWGGASIYANATDW